MEKNTKETEILPKSLAGKLCKRVVLLFYIVYFAVVNWPILTVANRIEPTILGMPFLVAWILIWWLIASVVAIIAAWKVWN
ncbi:MAG: hypothetical protein ACUVQ5_02620 [Candidatus Methanomethylicaceae archaeon]